MHTNRKLTISLSLLTLWTMGRTHAEAQSVYVSNYFSGTVNKVTSVTTVSAYASGLGNPRDLAFDQAGNLYVNDVKNGQIDKVAPNGTMTVFASGLGYHWGLVFDAQGALYTTNGSYVYKFSPAGVRTTVAPTVPAPQDLAVDPNGNIFVIDNVDNSIIKITPGGVKSTFIAGLKSPFLLAIDGNGNMIEADGRTGDLNKISSIGTETLFATGIANPQQLVFDSAGNLYVADNATFRVFEFTPNGTETTLAAGLSGLSGVAVRPASAAVPEPGVISLLLATLAPLISHRTRITRSSRNGKGNERMAEKSS